MRYAILAAAAVLAAGTAQAAAPQSSPGYGYGAGSNGGYPPAPSGYRGDDRVPQAYGQDGAPQGGYGPSAPADREGDSGADLVRQLNLRPDQRSAFQAYQTAFQSQQNEASLDDPSRLQAMTAPQRLDATAQQMERDRTDFARIDAATRRFYALLDPGQRRTFDRLTAPPLDTDQGGDDEGRGAPSRPMPPSR